ncbi:MAG: hypothetical protein CME12_09335 [Gemmatimonadetes bacterium]|nr:hypothetical protein [Gemmatimonadota bacterium]
MERDHRGSGVRMTKSEYQELEKFRSEVADSFREHRDLLRNSYRDLDLRMTSVEERFDRLEAD